MVGERALLSTEGNALTLEDVAYYFAQYQGLKYNKKQAYAHFTRQNFWDPRIMEEVKANRGVVTMGAGYMLLQDFTEGWQDHPPAQGTLSERR